jgi:hypothetical protein
MLNMEMEPHYDQHYFFAEKYGGKPYTDSAGQQKTFGYHAGGLWNFEGILFKLVDLLGFPESILDIGAGCGGFVSTCNMRGIEALGLEFSQYAIDHAVLTGKRYLKRWDIQQVPWPVTQKYDWITAIDLFEHIFDDGTDATVAETKRCARRWIIAKICTAKRPKEVWIAKRAPYEKVVAQAKREGFEWLVASGHINSQLPSYWLEKFVDDKWKNRADLAEKLKTDLHLPDDWRTTLVLENIKWFEEEFGP